MAGTTTNGGKMRRGVRLVLIASLTLNLLVLGVVVGAYVKHWRHDGPPAHLSRLGPPHIRALPGEARREIGQAIRKGYRDPDRRAAVGDIYTRLAGVLAATPFDREAVRTVLSEHRAVLAEGRAQAEDIWLNRVAEMSAETRKAYAERVADEAEAGRTPYRHKADKR
ncbi:Uncharacterized membrane protein [Salinihabitans flavidus]|uniref:Uncharacterized membrane protein n=1 Tax=Salinihabitans flavidus TaxID=569882 RepID=A0A1H8TRS7_9RHOB|nr:periplasmic heavy metal sensor [Salinihabitans flavidus]SEO93233.1 Uncharacterized membrane protein [Salinihabitans flavidus]